MDQQKRYRSDLIERHLSLMSKRGRLKQSQVPEYRRELHKMLAALAEEGMGCTPLQIGEKEIEWLLNDHWNGLSAKTKRWYLSILNGLLKRHKNTVISDMQLGWPRSQRVQVEWLTPEESVVLMDTAVGVERIVVHLELHLGLRRCEVQRLKLSDIGQGCFQIMGKGKGEGKPRTVAWAPETYEELPKWLDLRDRIVDAAMKCGKPLREPEELVIYWHGGRLQGYSDSGLDKIMIGVVERARIDKPGLHHRNRRTWGRLTMEAAGKDNERALLIVSESYGHEDLKQTRQYLGLVIDEQRDVGEKRAEYLERIKERMRKGLPPEKDFSQRITR